MTKEIPVNSPPGPLLLEGCLPMATQRWQMLTPKPPAHGRGYSGVLNRRNSCGAREDQPACDADRAGRRGHSRCEGYLLRQRRQDSRGITLRRVRFEPHWRPRRAIKVEINVQAPGGLQFIQAGCGPSGKARIRSTWIFRSSRARLRLLHGMVDAIHESGRF